MDACSDITLLNVIRIFKDLINVVTIIVPVILVIFVIVEVIKTITAGNVDTKKLMNSIAKRLIAAVVIFLLPYIIDFALGLFGNLKYKDCWENANKTKIQEIAIAEVTEKANAFCKNQSSTKAWEELRVAVKNIPSKKDRQAYPQTKKAWIEKCPNIQEFLETVK